MFKAWFRRRTPTEKILIIVLGAIVLIAAIFVGFLKGALAIGSIFAGPLKWIFILLVAWLVGYFAVYQPLKRRFGGSRDSDTDPRGRS